MARTRSTKPAAANSANESKSKSLSSKYHLEAPIENPQKLFVLPKSAGKDARIVSLPNPRNSKLSRYLVCPKAGIYEFKKISAPKTTPRSWLVQTITSKTCEKDGEKVDETNVGGHITANPDLFIATGIDPMFLILPALVGSEGIRHPDEKKALFLSSEDHFDKLAQQSNHVSEVLRWGKTRSLIESRMGAICDTVEAGDETMFRLSGQKLLSVLLEKARSMSENGLPTTMEERFVRKPLEAPMVVQKRDTNLTVESQAPGDSSGSAVSTPLTESVDSQSTVLTTETTASSISQSTSAATSFVEDTNELTSAVKASPEVISLQRIRVAFNFICSCYIAPHLAEQLESSLHQSGQSNISFSPLDEYLTEIAKIRSEVVASRSIGDYSRKHGRDEEEDEVRAEKKRKMEEEKRKKASETRGVRDLKKVNTSGMMKLSAFFKKK